MLLLDIQPRGYVHAYHVRTMTNFDTVNGSKYNTSGCLSQIIQTLRWSNLPPRQFRCQRASRIKNRLTLRNVLKEICPERMMCLEKVLYGQSSTQLPSRGIVHSSRSIWPRKNNCGTTWVRRLLKQRHSSPKTCQSLDITLKDTSWTPSPNLFRM